MTENNLHNPIPSYITIVNNLWYIFQGFSAYMLTHTHTFTHLLYKSWVYCYVVCKNLYVSDISLHKKMHSILLCCRVFSGYLSLI